MNEDVAKQWVAALRGGKYRQGFGRLHKDYSFCVLGVLCDVLNPGGWRRDPFVGGWAMEMQATKMPLSLLRKAEVQDIGPWLRGGGPRYNGESFVVLNDKHRLTFEEFAAIIEQHWRDI